MLDLIAANQIWADVELVWGAECSNESIGCK